MELVTNINAYLVDGPNVALTNRSLPLSQVPTSGIGNKPIDDGNYLFTDEEHAEFVRLEPASATFFRRFYGSREFINNQPRWCLWLGDCDPDKLRTMPEAKKRVQAVRAFRARSKSAPTRKIADHPTRFHVENMPQTPFLLIPRVSSEVRRFIPIGFMSPSIIASDATITIPDATLYHFGILTSTMHMAWVRQVAGRLKSDYRYSAKLVYNNFPWPQEVTDARRKAVEDAAQAVLDARAKYPNSTLADLYDPLTMPADLAKAHARLDKAVDRCYRAQTFSSERQRVEYLFQLYQQLTAPLLLTARRRPAQTRREEG
jgi:hypothetical protein